MEPEPIACPLEQPLPPGRKALLYLGAGCTIVVCVFLFFAALA